MIPTENLWVYDIEVFNYDWLVIFHPRTEAFQAPTKRVVFHNDYGGVRAFLNAEERVLGGFNSKGYDQFILRCIYNEAPHSIIKACNDWIIGGEQGWQFAWLKGKLKLPGYQFDLMDDIPVPIRLKEVEANLGMSIMESSVPFNIDRPLTKEEIDEVIEYCHHDVDTTDRLFDERRDYLQSKITIGALKGISWQESIGMTNAKMTARYLDAEMVQREDEFEYDFPENLIIDNATVVEFFTNIDYEKKLEIDIAGTPHIVAWGGLHGALEHYQEKSTDEREITSLDVASYYPSLMIINGYMSRNVPDPDIYYQVYERRMAAKKTGEKSTADALKLVLNTTYGAMKNKYNDLYDPHQANAVCISGQLYLIDLTEKLQCAVTKLTLIQSNTDGIILSYPIEQGSIVEKAVTCWEQRTGFSMEKTRIKMIVQKDVNNYVMLDDQDHVKVKGGYVSNFDGGSWKNASLSIVDKAVVESLIKGIPVERTIDNCSDIRLFQMVAKTGGSYDRTVYVHAGQDIEVQRTNRIFSTANEDCGTIYKVKTAENRRDKVSNAPDHCCIDNSAEPRPDSLDKSWYIELARRRIRDYLGIPEPKAPKPKKERKTKIMATRTKITPTTITTDETPAPQLNSGLNQKLIALQRIMAGFRWEKDGRNRHQSYTYITEAQYKKNFRAALMEVGLLFKFDGKDYRFIESISDKMHMIIATYVARLTDPDTGDYEEYTCYGSGADNGDKAIYKAETGAIKFFLAGNFLVAENNDPESDEEDIQREKPRFTTPEKKAEFKEKLTSQDTPATSEQLEFIAEGVAQLEAEGKNELSAVYVELLGTDLTKEMAEQAIEAIGEALG